MLSIIVAVHNQLGHNQLFLEGIQRYTTGPYEVIVIDNHSKDGSAEFFEANKCRVIRNDRNLCYPESMNLGSNLASGEFLCHINNDLYVAPNWNGFLIEAMEQLGLDVASPLGLEIMPTEPLTDWMHNRWNSVGRGRLSSGRSIAELRIMLRKMYGDWEAVSGEICRRFKGQVFEGINGSCVMVRRSLIDRIGYLDEQVQAADWDIYLTLRKREQEIGDVHRCMVVGGSFVHHFMRATVKGKPRPFGCTHPRRSIDEKWSKDEQVRFWYRPQDIQSVGEPRPRQGIHRRVTNTFKKFVVEIDRILSWRWLTVKPSAIVDIYRQKFATLGTRPGVT
ncbi:MAG TPA: glycosyltransferase [Nitrospiraceae bacterium]|jgi:GT2 family glycosyltransferase